jgi:hypothetical protein
MITYNSIDMERVTAAEATASMIHNTQATVLAQTPQAGTQTYTHMLTRVANPMGTVPRNKELVGSRIITPQISG